VRGDIAIKFSTHNDDRVAIYAILITVSTISLSDSLVKFSSNELPLWQIFTLRSFLAIPLLLLIIWFWDRRLSWWPKRIFWVSLRNLLMVSQAVLYYIAIPRVALAAVAATNYTMPLFVSIFAAFTGVLLIVQPATDSFNKYALLPLGAAMLAALANLLTKAKCGDEHPLVISLNLNIALLGTGVLGTLATLNFDVNNQSSQLSTYLLGPWSGMNLDVWIVTSVMAASFVVGSVGAAVAYQLGHPTTIATLDFVYIAFALLWGMIFFDEFPDFIASMGILILVYAGILVVRESRS